MHGDDRAAVMPGTVLQLFFQKTEIRDRVGVVVFDRIGIEANEFDVPDDKGKVFSPNNLLKTWSPLPITSWLPINPTYGISSFDRILTVHSVLFLHAELGIVSSVYDEIDAVFLVLICFTKSSVSS